mgnify:CR=1 FL=1
MKKLTLIVLFLIALTINGYILVNQIQLQQNCLGYLERAASSNTVETAKGEFKTATNYLETNSLTTGYTSILWKTPDEDINFWYNNLKSSESELAKVDSNTSALEKTNLLMKLRETLIDHDKDGDVLTYPNGLARYPDNKFISVIWVLSTLLFFGCLIYYIKKDE